MSPAPRSSSWSNDWFSLKDKLHEGTISTDQMWDCWRYRQQFVTQLIDLLRKDFRR